MAVLYSTVVRVSALSTTCSTGTKYSIKYCTGAFTYCRRMKELEGGGTCAEGEGKRGCIFFLLKNHIILSESVESSQSSRGKKQTQECNFYYGISTNGTLLLLLQRLCTHCMY